MNKTLIALLVLGSIAFGGITIAWSTYNSLNVQEIAVETSWKDSQVWYDTFWKKVQEQAQVTDKYAADFKEAFIGSVGKRYDGKDPAVSLIMEANPTLSPEVYTRLQTTIDAGRTDFAETQRVLLDKQRIYKTTLRSPVAAMLKGLFGFPSEEQGDLRPAKDTDGDGRYTVLDYPIVTSDQTSQAFTTGKADAISVFGK